jgi:hypothetical protein
MNKESVTVSRKWPRRFGVLLAVVVFALFLAPLQTAVARWFLSDLEFAEVEFTSLWLGPWGARVQDLRFNMPGVELQASELQLDIASWSSLLGLRLDIAQVSAAGIDFQIDQSAMPVADSGVVEQAPVAEPTGPFAGLSPLMRLPQWLLVRELSADGRLRYISSGELDISGPFKIELADLRPGHNASLLIDAGIEAQRDKQLLAALRGSAEGNLDIAADGAIGTANARLHITPAKANETRHIDATLAMDLSDSRETYSLLVDGSGKAQLVNVSAEFQTAKRLLNANWSARVTPGLVAAFMRGEASADLEGVSTGSARIDLAAPGVQLESNSQLRGNGWEAFDTRLAGLGQLHTQSDIRVSGWGQQWQVEQCDISLTVADGREVLHVDTLQPASFDFETSSSVPQRWGEPTVRLAATDLPLAWLAAFDPAEVFEDGTLTGALEIVPMSKGHLRLDADTPIRLSQIKLKANQRGDLPILDITIVPHARVENGELIASIDELTIASETGLRVDFKGTASSSRDHWPVIDLEGGIALRAPVLQRNIRELDAFRGVAHVQLDLGRQTLGIRTIGLDARSTHNTTLMSLELKGDAPLELLLPDWTPDWDAYEPQQLVLRLAGLPIEWLSPYLPEIELKSGDMYGELTAVAQRGEGFSLVASKAFEIRNIVPFYRGVRVARELSVELSPRVRLSNKEAALELENVVLQSLAGDRLGGELALHLPRDGKKRIAMELDFEGHFPSITDRISKLGALRWQQRGAIDMLSGETEVHELALSMSDSVGTGFINIINLRPFAIAGDPLRFRVEPGSAEVLRAVVTPLELQRLVPQLGALNLEGVLPQGEFFGRIDAQGRIVIAADKSLNFRNVTVRWEDALLFDDLTIGLNYEVAYSADGLEARSVDMFANNQQGERLGEVSLQAMAPLTAQKSLQSLDVLVQSSLKSLASQPLLAGLPEVLSGELSGSINLVNDNAPLLRAQAVVQGLSVEDTGRLPDLDISLAVDAVRGERLALEAPFRMNSQRGESDLNFVGEAVINDDRIEFDASLLGQQVIVPDLRMFLDYLMPPAAAEPEPVADTETGPIAREAPDRLTRSAVMQLRQHRDETPFWSDRLAGQATIDIAKLRFAPYTVDNIRGQLQVSPSEIKLTGIEASLLDAQLTTAGAIRFDSQDESPYDMRFDLDLSDLELGELLRSEDPGVLPVAEGLFSLRTELVAGGRNALDLGLASQGSIHLSGSSGIFRGLAGRGGTTSTAAGVVGVLTFSKELRAIGRILDDLETLSFAQFNVSLNRKTAQLISVDDLLLVSPLLRLEGSGRVSLGHQDPLIMSPLQASVSLATRDDMTILFDGMGLLVKEADAEGYRAVKRPVVISGTLAEPDTSDLWLMLDEAAENSKGLFGMGLRGINRKIKKSESKKAAK